MVKSRADRIKSDVSGPAPRDLGFSPEGDDASAASAYGRYNGILGQSLFDVVDSHAIGSRMQGRSSMIEEAGDEYRGWAKRALTLQTSSRRWSRVAFVCAGLVVILAAASRSCRWTAKRGGSARERRRRR